MSAPGSASAIQWEEWGPRAFERARSERKPVYLHFSHEEVSEGLADLLAARFVAVRVSIHERPDIHRSTSGEHILSADGRVIAAPQGLDALACAADAYDPEQAVTGKPDAGPVWTGAVGEFRTRKVHEGGPAAALAALKSGDTGLEIDGLLYYAAHEWGDAQSRAILSKLSDAVPEFDQPSGAEDLPRVVARLELYWRAFGLTGSERMRQSAIRAAEVLAGQYFDAQARGFRVRKDGAAIFVADINARAAVALLKTWLQLGSSEYFELAEETLHFLEKKMYDPLLGMIHCQLPGRPVVHGLLADNAWTALAFSEAYLATGHKPYREFADEIGRFLFQELWERERGGFLTRVIKKDDVGPLKEPRLISEENAVALEAVWRLSELKGNRNYRKWVEWGLKSAAFADDDPHLARIQDMLAKGRMDFELVGLLSDPKTEALLAAINRLYLPRKIVSFVDPNDQDYILAHKLEAPTYPRLFACGPDLRRVADTDDPSKVPEIVAALRR